MCKEITVIRLLRKRVYTYFLFAFVFTELFCFSKIVGFVLSKQMRFDEIIWTFSISLTRRK
jgi:hypothetical protein